jgi:hypothetical protein
MAKKVFQISFKDNEREERLYNAVINSYNKSAFVKECIEFYLDNKNKQFSGEVVNEGPVIDNKQDEEKSEVSDIDWEF